MKNVQILILTLFITSCVTKPLSLEEVQESITTTETEQILYTLASDEMKGRESASGGYQLAADFVIGKVDGDFTVC